jgi:hypothetical protein
MSRMTIVEFHPEHLRGFEIADEVASRMMAPVLADPSLADGLRAGGPAFTALVDNQPIACGGLFMRKQELGVLWAVMSPRTRYHLTAITRAIMRWLDGCGIRRIEAAVDAEYEISLRWHELMGFQREGLMECYTPDGRDAWLYARVSRR